MKTIQIFFFITLSYTLFAQDISWESIAPMPEPVTNNAVTHGTVNDIPFVYSFAGIDSTKACGNPHLKSFRYNTATDEWESIPPLPDPMGGKIAAGASTINNKIYIIGGYHVANNCTEISSRKVHIFDPETNSYLPDGADIPVAIDDQVQAVWQDSLIYVVTGWSNTTNVVDVQIYNPATDEWTAGTPIPNNSQWRVFGASGLIIGNEIIYIGGASSACSFTSCFGPTTIFRRGIINPDNPTEITWESNSQAASQGYRMAATPFEGKGLWLGGSDITYNFDGIDYNGSGGVAPLDRITIYEPDTDNLSQLFGVIPAIMDLRGIAQISDNEFIIAGGMVENQTVTNQAFKITINNLTAVLEVELIDIEIFPNPTTDILNIELDGNFDLMIRDISGKIVAHKQIFGKEAVDVSRWASGVYFLEILKDGQFVASRKFLKN